MTVFDKIVKPLLMRTYIKIFSMTLVFALTVFLVSVPVDEVRADLSQTTANATTTLGGSKLVDLGTGLSGTVTGLSLMFADATCVLGFCDNPVSFQVMPYNPETLKIIGNDHLWLSLYKTPDSFWHPSSIRANLGQFLFAGTERQTGEPADYKLDPRKYYVAGVRAHSNTVFGPSLYGAREHVGPERFVTEKFLDLEHRPEEPVPAFILHGDIERLESHEIPPEGEVRLEIDLEPGEEIIYQRLPEEATGGVSGVVGIAFNEGDPRGEAFITRVIVSTNKNRNLWAIQKFNESGHLVTVSEVKELEDGFTEFEITEPFRLKESVRHLFRAKRYALRLVRISDNGFSLRTTSILTADDTDGSVEVETGQANRSRRIKEDPVMTLIGRYDRGNSNVAFIPGLQASRLYIQEGDIFENRIWEPGSDTDGEKLFMDSNGESVENVYTRDIIDEGAGIVNIYKSFIEEMDGLVASGDIAEWRALPYDWRKNVFDVVREPVALPDGASYEMISAIEELAASSAGGKVTIVAHSNGGLVAKALISELEALGKADLVDKLVLVAVPQVGTPKAVASILHGDGQERGLGVFLTQETARELGENMPGGYGLLPSGAYFGKASDPVVTFDEDSSTTAVLRALYGDEITDSEAFHDFMIGDREGRQKPDRDDLLSPIVANSTLLSEAESSQSILDAWSAPEGIEVTQIIGWGLDTLKGIEYKDKEVIVCSDSEPRCDREIVMDHTPLLTKDGDVTVMSLSAKVNLGKSYFLNFNDNNHRIGIPRKHSDILEVDSVLELIDSIIKSEEGHLPEFITETKPSVSEAGESLRLSVHSPVSIGVRDSEGNFTGITDDSDLIEVSEEIPNSFYLPFGDGKYLGVPVGEDYSVEIFGEDTGVFTFNIENLSGDTVSDTESFTNIPVNSDTEAFLEINPDGSLEVLNLDVDGDRDADVSLSPGEEFSPADYIAVLKEMIENSDINKGARQSLLARLSNVEKALLRGSSGNSTDALLNSMIQSLQNESASEIIRIINILREILSD